MSVCHSGEVNMSCTRNSTNAATLTLVPTLLMSLASLVSCRLSGVFTAVISVDLRATFPISVASPTAVTTATPRPAITIVERSMRSEG